MSKLSSKSRSNYESARLHGALLDLGLSQAESSVYLACLRLNSASVASIARAAGIRRTTTYTVLQRLAAGGYVARELKGKVQRYGPSHPEQLNSLLFDRLQRFQTFLPELLTLFNLKGAAGNIRILEGVEASKQAYETLLRVAMPKEPYLVLSNVDKWLKLAPQYFKKFIERRAEKGLAPRHLLVHSETARKWLENVGRVGATGKLLPKQISFSINLVITPRLVVIHQLVDPVYAVLMESPMIAELFMQMYEVLWQVTPEKERS
jgi:sugar-specific transcriptional regulator TrmB